MTHPFRWIALTVGVGVLAFSVMLAVNVDTDPRADLNTSRLLGKPAPELALTRLDGTRLTSADLVGKTVIINFWNSWCLPCREELPALQQWYANHKDDPNLVFIGIPRDDSSAAIRAAAREDQMAWAVANDRGAKAAALSFATRGQPETFAVSPDGIIKASLLGPASVEVLDQLVRYGRGDRR